MESKKDKMLAIMKRYIEACRGWKRIWKVLAVLGVISVVAVALFFAIPNPYRDAWDDLFLPYPEEFPEPGVFDTKTLYPPDTIKLTYMTRKDILPSNMNYDSQNGIRNVHPNTYPYQIALTTYGWRRYTAMIAEIEIINYADVYYGPRGKPYPCDYVWCLAVCKIRKVFATTDELQKADYEGKIITIGFSGSSKKAVGSYPELAVGQRWITALGDPNQFWVIDVLRDPETDEVVPDYWVTGPTHNAISLPVYTDWLGNEYVDTKDVEYALELCYEEKPEYDDADELFPFHLIKNHRVYDFEALTKFFEETMKYEPYQGPIKFYRLK